MDQKRDWQALALKLASGKSFEISCDEAGIPVDEAKKHFQERLEEISFYHIALNEISIEILKDADAKLKTIMDAGPRFSETQYNEDGRPTSSTTPLNVDLDAAKARARLAIDIRKLLLQESKAPVTKEAAGALGNLGKGVGGFMRDLFDLQGGVAGPWKLKNPNEI